jgi:hypothetical protein
MDQQTKHSECSDCTHPIYLYEIQRRYVNTSWGLWSGVILAGETAIRQLLDIESIKYVTCKFTNRDESRYRKVETKTKP